MPLVPDCLVNLHRAFEHLDVTKQIRRKSFVELLSSDSLHLVAVAIPRDQIVTVGSVTHIEIPRTTRIFLVEQRWLHASPDFIDDLRRTANRAAHFQW